MENSCTYISVILPLKLDWEPCYKIPQDMQDGRQPETGERIEAVFAGKTYTGVISKVGIDPEVDTSKIRSISRLNTSLERISETEIMLWRLMADYYMCTAGEVYKAAYPVSKTVSEETVSYKENRRKAAEAEELRKAENRKSALEGRILKKEASIASARKESVREKYSAELSLLRTRLEEISGRIDLLQEKKDISRYNIHTPGIALSETQKAALAMIKEAFSEKKTVLLNGVTGSGKTEIYITLAAETLAAGKNVLYLVPEIAVGKQIAGRLEKVFGDRLLTFHSGESISARAAVTSAIRKSGDRGYIVTGTRSAVLLPHNNLGLVIVDEEHDSSYKQDSPTPRYNGRDTATMLGTLHACNVLLGSATPSLESIYNCKTGKYALVTLSEKYHKAPSPEIEIIDTSQERKKRGMRGSLSLKLISKIGNAIEKGEQTVILRSRRSYSPVIQCTECGFIPVCPRCNISLSYHKTAGKNICHYCGYSVRHSDLCPKCGGTIGGIGTGTQKIEEEISALFPKARIARLDGDSAKNRKFESETIRKFSKGEIDILIGTQIVTKGFDFSGLTLVAVINSDSMLGLQDFRADEKALRTLEQFRGRCGRRENKGMFVIQTAMPQHPVYSHLANGTENAAVEMLLKERKAFGYPPYCRIIDIHIKDNSEARAESMSSALCMSLASAGFRTTGPYLSSASGKNAGYYGRTIRINMEKDKALPANKKNISALIGKFEQERNYRGHISADVDPI